MHKYLGRNTDPREEPAYKVGEAARFLGIPPATLRSWALGRRYPTARGSKKFEPVLLIPDRKHRLLSFFNVVEAHILSALRREHGVSLGKIRKAIRFIDGAEDSRHPLLDLKFTDGIDVFVEKFGRLISASEEGQLVIKDVLKAYLQRIERGRDGLPVRLYPYTRGKDTGEPRQVMIDPLVAYGQPAIAGSGVPVAAVVSRCKAGESIDELAADYGLKREAIEAAIRLHLNAA